jgi:hypothetical protein
MPCSTEWGLWSNGQGCYLTQASLGAGDPAARGHDLDSEQAYWCTTLGDGDPSLNIPATVSTMWTPIGETAGGSGQAPVVPQPVDATVLAQRAVDRLRFATAQPRMAPTPPDPTYVGLETWVWLPGSQWHTLTARASAGPTTVTVSARPVRVDWLMGETAAGTDPQFSCAGAGEAWEAWMAESAVEEQTGCSYTYTTISRSEPGGAFEVQAEIVYDVVWSCAGACTSDGGDFGELPGPSSSTPLRVSERQSVVINHPHGGGAS